MKDRQFTTVDGESHRIDRTGNHFINGKCVNPKAHEGEIGDTYPSEDEIAKEGSKIQITGYIEGKIVDGKFVRI